MPLPPPNVPNAAPARQANAVVVLGAVLGEESVVTTAKTWNTRGPKGWTPVNVRAQWI